MLAISSEKKIDIVYSYLFSNDKSIEEEDFWNKLSKKVIKNIENIETEETFDFNLLKSKVLGK